MAMKHFFVGVKGIVQKDGLLLLMHDQRNGKDYWDVPGGRIDDDETIEQTLARELKEELPGMVGYTVGPLVHAYRLHKDIEDDISLTLLFYSVTDPVFDGPLRTSTEHSEARWCDMNEAIRIGSESIQDALKVLTSR